MSICNLTNPTRFAVISVLSTGPTITQAHDQLCAAAVLQTVTGSVRMHQHCGPLTVTVTERLSEPRALAGCQTGH